ncbi:MAG TPA: class 1 fructose-bisphosphatase [Gemmatimonadetes bacterium]|nr:class 1 fructose-bisphosphatase [Gemmatimonadota bacterium]
MYHTDGKENTCTLQGYLIGAGPSEQILDRSVRKIINGIAFASKIISREVGRISLSDLLGEAGGTNVQGETVQKLDIYSEKIICDAIEKTSSVCCMVSEESEDILSFKDVAKKGDYVLLFDPLDGSSNIDVNISTGTIFSIQKRVTPQGTGTIEDCLQPGSSQVAAGYVLYGASTMLILTLGRGVVGFTLDTSIGEFILSHPRITLGEYPGRAYSVNEGNYPHWSESQKCFIRTLKGLEGGEVYCGTSRYVGSLVADFHRTLFKGGIFAYPADSKNPNGKLRLLYEASPVAMICEQAGGKASTGEGSILDVVPTDLHCRTPVYVGSSSLVDLADSFLSS